MANNVEDIRYWLHLQMYLEMFHLVPNIICLCMCHWLATTMSIRI